ncbi:MAG: TolC family protein [Saprospiraceae bacterium]
MKSTSSNTVITMPQIGARNHVLSMKRTNKQTLSIHGQSNHSLLIRIIICLCLFVYFQTAFSQNKLTYYLNQARGNSPLLKDFQYQILTNAIDSQRIRASYLPQVNANIAGTYAPITNGWGYDDALSNSHTFNALFTVSQTVVGRKNLNNQFLSLQIQNRSLQNQAKISEQDLSRTIAEQYINAYGDLLQIKFNEQMLELLKDEETIIKTLAEKGVYKQTDFLSFLVTIQQQELLLTQLKNQYQADFGNLNYSSGIADTTMAELLPPDLDSTLIPSFNETVFYNQYAIDSLRIAAEDAKINYLYKPTASIYGDAGYSSSFIKTPYKNFGYSVGANINIPIYDGRQRELQHAKNVIAQQNRIAYKNFSVSQYRQQTAQLQKQLVLAGQLIKQTTDQIKYTEGLISAQRQQLITGDVLITDYINAIGNYLNAKNIITQNTINRWLIINQINYWNRKL